MFLQIEYCTGPEDVIHIDFHINSSPYSWAVHSMRTAGNFNMSVLAGFAREAGSPF